MSCVFVCVTSAPPFHHKHQLRFGVRRCCHFGPRAPAGEEARCFLQRQLPKAASQLDSELPLPDWLLDCLEQFWMCLRGWLPRLHVQPADVQPVQVLVACASARPHTTGGITAGPTCCRPYVRESCWIGDRNPRACRLFCQPAAALSSCQARAGLQVP